MLSQPTELILMDAGRKHAVRSFSIVSHTETKLY